MCRELVPEIYRCLHLLRTLSDGRLSSFHSTLLRAILLELKQLSQNSEEAVQAYLTPLFALVKRMESNTQLDTQEIIFNISDKVTDLRQYWFNVLFPSMQHRINFIVDDRAYVDRLHYAKRRLGE